MGRDRRKLILLGEKKNGTEESGREKLTGVEVILYIQSPATGIL